MCEDQRARVGYDQGGNATNGTALPAYGQEVFASQADCCLPGLGGFKDGCSTMRI